VKPFRGRRKKSLAMETGGTLAARARQKFRTRVDLLLGTLATNGAHNPTSVLLVLERYCDQLLLTYLRSSVATVAAWEEFGPERDRQEIRDAVNGKTAFDEIVKRYRRGGQL
jgi:hypothetical protein